MEERGERLQAHHFCRLVEFLAAFKSLKRLQLSSYVLTGHPSAYILDPLDPNAHDWYGLEKLGALQEVHIAAVADFAGFLLQFLCSVPRLASLSIEYITCPLVKVAFPKHYRPLEIEQFRSFQSGRGINKLQDDER